MNKHCVYLIKTRPAQKRSTSIVENEIEKLIYRKKDYENKSIDHDSVPDFFSFFSRDILRKIILRHLSLILFLSDEKIE
jgi:hypothetical protein